MKNKKDKIKKYDGMLQKHIDKKDFVKVIRTFKDREENVGGFILFLTKEFLILQIDNEFTFDGYAIIPKHRFDSIRCNKFDKTSKKIYKGEGLLDSLYGFNQTICLTTWQKIFIDLKKLDYHVVVECEDKEEPEFIIGPIKRIYKDKVNIQFYDPAGNLDNKSTSVKYKEITILKFGDRYSTTFKKYLK